MDTLEADRNASVGDTISDHGCGICASLQDAFWYATRFIALITGIIGLCIAFGVVAWHFVDVAIANPENGKALIGGIVTAFSTLVVVYGRKPLEALVKRPTSINTVRIPSSENPTILEITQTPKKDE